MNLINASGHEVNIDNPNELYLKVSDFWKQLQRNENEFIAPLFFFCYNITKEAKNDKRRTIK